MATCSVDSNLSDALLNTLKQLKDQTSIKKEQLLYIEAMYDKKMSRCYQLVWKDFVFPSLPIHDGSQCICKVHLFLLPIVRVLLFLYLLNLCIK